MNELTKTSLLVIATIFTGAGSSILQSNVITGSALLLIAVGILILRGWLKQKGINGNKWKSKSKHKQTIKVEPI
jgi:high-affinity Fe2+/Pb2+ permease